MNAPATPAALKGCAATALCALTIACAPKSRYVAPTVEVAPAFRENANWKTPEPRDTEIRGQWWELFDDPVLNDLEARVDVSNQSIRASEAQFAQARAFVHGARANLGPQISLNPSIAAVQPSGSRAVSSFHDVYGDFLLPVSVSYEADVWGRLHGILEANRTAAQATAADLETARLSIHAELAADYFTLRGLDSEQALLDTTVTAFERALELTGNRFRGGIASQADVALAETQLETTRAQAVDIRAARAALEHAIAVLVGVPASVFVIPASPLNAAPPPVPVGVPSALLERRPDVAAAERRVASASAQVGVATSAFYPILTLSAAGGFEASSIGAWLAGASSFWTIGPSLFVNVFDNGRRKAVKEQAVAQYDLATAVYRQSLLVAFREVEDQLNALRVLEEEAQVQDRAVAASERSLTLANNRYRGGVTSYLEVLATQSAALNNQRAAVNILIRRMNATVLLLKGLGGGWNAASLPALTGS